ncbi:hypothetical protein RRG08_013495 [Elysia crispata]|uniref:Uncharacterized protein n=1 Tax=Elysia crispata TaxID=231223 RepID=A0AAE1CQG4_9GAST|nr:hypothetical protein RRG08_013495 [Elysia crispata]
MLVHVLYRRGTTRSIRHGDLTTNLTQFSRMKTVETRTPNSIKMNHHVTLVMAGVYLLSQQTSTSGLVVSRGVTRVDNQICPSTASPQILSVSDREQIKDLTTLLITNHALPCYSRPAM